MHIDSNAHGGQKRALNSLELGLGRLETAQYGCRESNGSSARTVPLVILNCLASPLTSWSSGSDQAQMLLKKISNTSWSSA